MKKGLLVAMWAGAAVLGMIAVWQILDRPAPPGPGLRNIDFPSWSPDGTTIVFSAATSGGYDLWTIDPTPGATPRQLTTSLVDEVAPAWGPTGRIAYAADQDAALTRWMSEPVGNPPHASIQTVLEDGGDPIQLTHHEETGTIPAWEADGAGLTFWCPSESRPARCRIETTFEGYEVLAEDPGSMEGRRSVPSPDGSARVEVQDGPQGPGLYLIEGDEEPVALVVSD